MPGKQSTHQEDIKNSKGIISRAPISDPSGIMTDNLVKKKIVL